MPPKPPFALRLSLAAVLVVHAVSLMALPFTALAAVATGDTTVGWNVVALCASAAVMWLAHIAELLAHHG